MERNIKANANPPKQGLFNLRNVSTYKKVKYLILALAIFIALTMVYNMIVGSLSEAWTETEGAVVRSIEKSGDGAQNKSQNAQDDKIREVSSLNTTRYEYQVKGKKYISGRISYPQVEYRAEKGAQVKVYYWELFPNFSVIVKGNKTELSTIIQFGALMLIGILLIIINPPDKEKDRSGEKQS